MSDDLNPGGLYVVILIVLLVLTMLQGCAGAAARAATPSTYVTGGVTLTCDRTGCSVATSVEVTREVAP